jgi:hypothetical protein
VADVLLAVLFLRDGLLLGLPVPPFDGVTHPNQRAWVEGLADGESPGNGRFDAQLGWTWRPSSVSAEGVTIGALGARGPREYAPLKPEGRTRVLTFGDSFTFGDGIKDGATFQRIFEGRHRDFEVLNFGVSGYGTDQALLRYRSLGRDLGADVVCIGIMLENIGRNVNRFRPLWNTRTGFCATKPRFVAEGDGLRLLAQPFATEAELRTALLDGTLLERVAEGEHWRALAPPRWSFTTRVLSGLLGERRRSPARLWQDEEAEPFRTTLALLEAFQREALEGGASLAPILVFPAPEDLERALAGRPYWTGFLAELERRGLDHVDLIPPLAARERELEGESGPASLYFKAHLSSVGNSVVADALYAWLEPRLAAQEER